MITWEIIRTVKCSKIQASSLIKLLNLQQNQEDVLVEKEVIKGPKVSHKVKKEVEDDEIVVTNNSNEPVQDSDERLLMNNLLVDNNSLLQSDDEEDDQEVSEKL